MALAWWHLELFSAFCGAALFLAVAPLRLNGRQLALVEAVALAVLSWPPALATVGGFSAAGWAVAVGAGMVGALAAVLTFNCIIRFGAGPVSRLIALSPLASFLVWGAVDRDFSAYATAPWRLVLTVAALCGCVAAMVLMRRSPVTRAAILALLPVIALFGVTNTLVKLGNQASGGFGASLLFLAVANTAGAAVIVASGLLGGRRYFPPVHLRQVGIALAVIGPLAFLNVVSRYWSVALAENPGYPSALGLSAALWIVAWNRWRGISDDVDVLPGLLFVASVVALIVLAP